MRPADIKRLEKVCNLYSKIIGLLNVVEGNIDPNDTYSMAVVRQMDVSVPSVKKVDHRMFGTNPKRCKSCVSYPWCKKSRGIRPMDAACASYQRKKK